MRFLASRICPHAVAVLLLGGMLLPRSPMEVAAKIGYESHVVSFLIGPALYAFGEGLVPGIDYFSQYSVGLPFAFAPLLGPSADAAIVRYVRLITLTMFAFYLGLFYCLRWMMSSWKWALAITVTTALLQFHVDRTFFDPSSYVLRYPLLVLAVWLAARWAGADFPTRLSIGVALVIGASVFLNTESGVMIALVSLVVGFACCDSANWRRWVVPPMVFGGGCIAFLLLSFVAFGAKTLTIEYLRGLFLPFLIYGGGFGGVGIDWRFGEHLLYNVVAPGVAVVTAVLCIRRLWRAFPGDRTLRCRTAALLGFSVFAILLSAKYINMSLVALWHVNAIGFVVVLGWWACQLHHSLSQSPVVPTPGIPRTARMLAVPAVSIGLAVALLFSNDPRNPNLYGVRAWAHYPSLINPESWRRLSGCRELACSAPRILESDVQLIQRWTRPNDRVALLSPNDWAYLIPARRASWFLFLPSTSTFTRDQLAAAIVPPPLVFLPRSTDLSSLPGLHKELGESWRQLLADYEPMESANSLTLWKRKP